MRETEEGLKLAKFIAAITEFHGNLARLLSTAQDFLGKDRWVPASDNSVWMDSSTSIELPSWWTPKEVYRFLKNDQVPHVLIIITVLLDNRHGKEQHDFKEPLVCATWFDFGDARPGDVGTNWKKWYAQWPTYDLRDLEYGAWKTVEVANLSETDRAKNAYAFRKARFMAVPLSEIVSAEVLKAKIIDPLLHDISLSPQEGRG